MNRNKKMVRRIVSKAVTAAFSGMLLLSGTVAYHMPEVRAMSVTEDAVGGTYSSQTAGDNAILADGNSITLSDITVSKSGNGNGEDADFYGTNAAVLAKNGAALTINRARILTNGSYAYRRSIRERTEAEYQ